MDKRLRAHADAIVSASIQAVQRYSVSAATVPMAPPMLQAVILTMKPRRN